MEPVYDSAILQPETGLKLELKTRVRLTVEVLRPTATRLASFLSIARSFELHGPADRSASLDNYLYGNVGR